MQENLNTHNFRAKRYILLACSIFGASTFSVTAAKAQSPTTTTSSNVAEPTAAGIFYFLDPTGTSISLEYRAVQRQTTKLQVQGDRSPVRFPAGTPFRFLVRLPSGTAGIDRLDIEQGWRTIPVRRVGNGQLAITKGAKDAAVVQFDSTSFGSGSLILVPKVPLRPGEYCMGASVSQAEAYCFGVDVSATVSEAQQAPPDSPGKPAMTNADVIKLVSAGLSPDIVASSIRQAVGRNFDMSVDGLITLKTNKVPDSVIATMQQFVGASAVPPVTKDSPTPQQPTGLTTGAKIPPEPPDLSVFYYVNAAGRLGRLEASKADLLDDHRTLFDGVQAKLQIFGAKSAVRFSDGAVSIVVKLPQKRTGFTVFKDYSVVDLNEMLFRRWESTPGARQLWFTASKVRRGQKHDPDPGEFDVTISKLGDSFYKVAPTEPLIPGEYCIALTSVERHYCFGIDAAR